MLLYLVCFWSKVVPFTVSKQLTPLCPPKVASHVCTRSHLPSKFFFLPLPFADHHFSPKHHRFLLICSNMDSRVISLLFSFFIVFCSIYDSFFKPVIFNNQPLCPLPEGLNFHLLSVNFTLKNCCLNSETASSPESVVRLSGTKRPEEVSPRSVQGSGSL